MDTENTKTVVVYGSRYGSTKRYAEHIAAALGCAAVPAEEVRRGQLGGYKTVVFGGGAYAGSICGWKKIARHCRFALRRKQDGAADERERAAASGQRWVLFVCGLADPSKEKTRREARMLFDKRLPAEAAGTLPVFCLRGDLDYAVLGAKHRTMMRMLVAWLRRKQDPSAEDKQLLASYGGAVRFFDAASAAPVIAAARGGDDGA